MVERVSTGIPKFDGLMEGGFPKGSTVLLTGLPGTGKSILGLQFICNGIKNGENGVYIYAESHLDSLVAQALQMGFDLYELQKDGKLALINVPLDKKKFDLLFTIQERCEMVKAKRVVFDSLASFIIDLDLFTIPSLYAGNSASLVSIANKSKDSFKNMNLDDDVEMVNTKLDKTDKKVLYKGNQEKRLIYLIVELLRNLKTTNLLITFSDENGKRISVDGLSEFISDGIIQLYNNLVGGKRIRTMTILKMRNTNHSQYIHNFEIDNEGIILKPEEQVYD